MSLPVWPTSLPSDVLRRGFTIAPGNNLLVSEGDTGVGKVRRKGATPPITYTDTLRVSSIEEMTTFDTFYGSTLEDGALRFEDFHPITRASVELRIVPISSEHPYKWVPDGKGWSTPLKFTILP